MHEPRVLESQDALGVPHPPLVQDPLHAPTDLGAIRRVVETQAPVPRPSGLLGRNELGYLGYMVILCMCLLS